MKQQESLAIKYNITETNLEIRREFIRLGEKDRKILISLIPWARKVAPVLAKEFYDWQFSFHPTRQFFEKIAAEQSTSLSALRQVLENAQTEYYVGIFTGAESNWGASYFEGRMRIGMIHDKINLPQKWYMGSYAEYQYLTRKHLRKSFRLSFRKVARAEEAIFKVFNYDQQAVCDSFLFNTFDSVGLSVDDIKTTGSADRTEHVDQIKLAADTLLKQAEAISAERMDDEVLKTKVAGTLGSAVKTMAGNLRKSKDEIDAAMAKVETNLKVAQGVVDEVNRVAEVLKEGKLSERADPGDADGAFKKLVEGFNTAIDNILEPVNEAVAVLKEMSKGDLTLCVTGDYKGDHSIMKEAMNSTLAALNNTLGQVATTVHQVSTGAQEVSNASQSLSQGATSQASSLQETTASMTEIGSQTKQNADNATQANQLATSAAHSAEHGDKQMKLMLTAMSDINEASDDISKIIKVIDEIAFQTNLLALNAAVEAARAGVHGKGFAVVAEEVRNLAQRSAKAAKETTQLIEGSVKKVGNGTEIANNTANALGEIVVGITKATDFVGEIASASNEQAMGIEEINQALCQIDNVTQANTAAAEESAAAAEELSSQAAHLQQILSKFKLKNQNVGSSNLGHATANVTVVDATPEQTQQGERGNRSNNTKKSTVAKPEEIISFDDDDFGKF